MGLQIYCFYILLCWNSVSFSLKSQDFEEIKFEAEKHQNSPNKILELNNFVIDDKQSNLIYIGATNRLYQLDEDLDLSFEPIETGPVLDGIVCRHGNVEEYTDNINKLLLIDYHNKRLIICGSIEQGICELREVGNIKNRLFNYSLTSWNAYQLVSGTGNLSTTSFLVTLTGSKDFMFVGSSKTDVDISSCDGYSSAFTFSRRALFVDENNKMFSNFPANLGQAAGIEMEKSFSSKNYRLSFIDSFFNGITGYFVLTRPSTLNGNSDDVIETTYISQVCLEDTIMSSYLELPLECNYEGVRYTKAVASRTAKVGTILKRHLYSNEQMSEKPVVFISFIQSNGQPGSAVCLFPIQEIEKKFSQLVKRCIKGSVGPLPERITWIKDSGGLLCSSYFDVSTPVCHTNSHLWEVSQFMEGAIYSRNAVHKTEDTTITAIEIALTNDGAHTVMFLGTDDGYMLKVKADSLDFGSPGNMVYERIPVNPLNSATNSRLPKSNFAVKQIKLGFESTLGSPRMYAMTPSLIRGFPLFNCAQYKSCSSCLNSNDSFCGWCTLESKCSSSNNCSSLQSSNPFMFIQNREQCPSLNSVDMSPLVFTVARSQEKIKLRGHSIPYLQDQYYCKFGSIYLQKVTSIQQENNGKESPLLIRCVTPPRNQIPKFPPEKGDLTVPLSLVYEVARNTKVIASTEVTFYNCSVFASCVTCVQSHFNCSWCLEDNICSYQSTSYCPQSNVQHSNSCPQLSSHTRDEKVYLPAGRASDVSLPVRNLPDKWLTFTCKIDFNNGQNPVLYFGERGISRKHIVCRDVEGLLPDDVRNQSASVQVTANGNTQKIPIDNPENLSIEVYRCSLGNEDNCGQCLESPSSWQCGWCEARNLCTLSRDCSDWLRDNDHDTCRNPQITSFSPATAPFGSNSTMVTLHGINFDSNRRMVVRVAGVTCQILSATCCEVTCKPTSSRIASGQIKLCITDDNNCVPSSEYTALSTKEFHFVDPKITSFTPNYGLRGFGSRVRLFGKHLNTGNEVLVSVAGSECLVESRSATEIQCRLPCAAAKSRRAVAKSALRKLSRTKRDPTHSENHLVATFDGIHRVSRTGYFVFEENPLIMKMDPMCTIRSGGLPLTVHSVGLHLVPDPRILVRLKDGSSHSATCEEFEGDLIICQTPDISKSPLFRSDSELSATVGLFNSGCESKIIWFESELRYGPDPNLDSFDGEKQTKQFRSEAIYITGKNLCADQWHCDLSTVSVLIGDDLVCNVTRLDIDQITCLPQTAEREGSYAVKVLIGGYSKDIGYLQYSHAALPFYIIFIIAGAVLVVLLVITAVVCVYRNRAKASDLELKNVQMQMDLMDAKVAKICKEAFAELQTDMCQLDTYAGGAGVPYLKYSSYLMRVLFPDPSTNDLQHSLLYSTMQKEASFGDKNSIYNRGKTGMDRFDQLLGNKIFLLCLIKTIEKQQSFLVKDRAKVGGLIMIILHNRLQYATEILENLLADLINRNMESRSHPKLLLRRTESVAEKMLTHWFSILLHGFVEECAGEPLYTLFRAIKQQVDKGPLDSFTNEARYSLSEDKLLRQSVDHDVIHLRVVNYLGDDDQTEFGVKVLSCDSILQVKRKILDVGYMGVGYSCRPHPEDIDLEVLHNKLLPLILHDEDATSEVETEWRRVNTLQHYEIKSGTRVSLIPKTELSVFNSSLVTVPSKSSLFRMNGTGTSFRGFNSGDSVTSSLPRHRVPGMGTLTLPHNTMKQWHLVKPNDQDQPEGGDRGSKMVSEVYLTRLLTTKGTIQKYVDDLFETIFSVVQRGHDLPIAVKHMFDFLDHQADIHGISDPEVVHTWKSNCLPLRFWVNLIKNPEFIFDVHKSPIVDCYLSVIAQAFMDSCSTAEYKLGKDSPSNKLLYAKEIPEYRQWVKRYYSDISNRSKLHPRDLAQFLQDESTMHTDEFNRSAALSQLFVYVQKYNDDILTQLQLDPEASRQRLASKLDELLRAVNGKT